MELEKKHFNTLDEFEEYAKTLWNEGELKDLYEKTNDRFEMLLRNAVTVRHEVRTGVRESNEKILVTIYEWIQRFMERTHKEEVIEGIKIGQESGRAIFDLYHKTVQFLPIERN